MDLSQATWKMCEHWQRIAWCHSGLGENSATGRYYKTPTERKALNEARMYCIAAIRYYATMGIIEYPVFGLAVHEQVGALIMGWMSSNGVSRSSGESVLSESLAHRRHTSWNATSAGLIFHSLYRPSTLLL